MGVIMAIVNRDNDSSQQRIRYVYQDNEVIGVSTFIPIGLVTSSQKLLTIVSAAQNLSGSPIVGIQVSRFLPGVGYTIFPVNSLSLMTISAYSTSGVQTHAVGTSVYLTSGDYLSAVTSTANTAASYNISAVCQILQDVGTDYGV